MIVGFYQNEPRFGDVKTNVEKAVEELSRAEADLIVLPELFNTGYQFTSRKEASSLSEEIPYGYTCRMMEGLAKARDMYIVFGMAEKKGSNLFNSAVLVGPSGYLGLYRKTHLFFDEKDFFQPGDTGFRVFDTGKAKIGIMICFDWFFPEASRVLSLLGAQIICHPANLVLPYCQRSMPTRCLENRVFAITANRTGSEQRGGKVILTFTGKSQIVDPEGNVIACLGEKETGIVVTRIDPKKAKEKKITPKNDLFSDRRPEFYHAMIYKN